MNKRYAPTCFFAHVGAYQHQYQRRLTSLAEGIRPDNMPAGLIQFPHRVFPRLENGNAAMFIPNASAAENTASIGASPRWSRASANRGSIPAWEARSSAFQEWRAAMENRPPRLDDGRERHLENLSTHDMERLVSEAFGVATSLSNAADGEAHRTAMREGLHTFDMLRERYGLTQDGLWITATDMNESQRTLIHCP